MESSDSAESDSAGSDLAESDLAESDSAESDSTGFDWRRFLGLTAAGLVGVLAVIPYQLAAIKIPEVGLTDVLVPVFLSSGTLVAVSTLVGTALAERIGLRVRSAESDARTYAVAAAAGAAVAVLIVALDAAAFQQFLRNAALEGELTEATAPLWARALAGLYGGVTEELLLRYGLMTLLVWAGWKLRRTPDGRPTDAGVWTAILLTALVFGAGHLPATAAMVDLTPGVVARALVLNGLGGVLFGWLYWKRDLLAAMVAHFAADVVLVVVVPAVLG